jgi:hypothetical protein
MLFPDNKNIFPISFSIPDECVVSDDWILKKPKTRLLAEVTPWTNETNYLYDYGQEDQYHEQYQESWMAHTCKKGGWDCLRHYEILANGCIPLFRDLDACPTLTLFTLPKTLLIEALACHADSAKMLDLRRQLLAHTRMHCTTSTAATNFFCDIKLKAKDVAKPILLLTCHPGENYLRETLCIGLRRALGPSKFIEYPRIDCLYDDFDCKQRKAYGRGFTYTCRLKVSGDDCKPEDRANISDRILNHDFSHIVYGKVGIDEGPMGTYWQDMPFWREVQAAGYGRKDISFLYGGDRMNYVGEIPSYEADGAHLQKRHVMKHAEFGNVFLREFSFILQES